MMSIGFFIVIGATFCVALVAAWFLVAPFLEAEAEPRVGADRETLRLSEQRDALLEQLAELESEFRLGNLASEEFEATRVELVSEIAGVISQIEKTVSADGDDTGAELHVHARTAERQ